MLADFDLTGRKAFVTGPGRGIGKEIALALAEAGADIGVTALSKANAQRVAKAGLTRFTESLALEWARYGIRVNAIAPGRFPEPEQLSAEEWPRRQRQGAPNVPLGRFGQVRAVGLLAVYLASSAGSYVTSQSIGIDGGRTLL
jgi:NAD(P)-dependent dehydrogenase (short-subunit alcohol dehydrogenase family)